MADVFISYAREESTRAEEIRRALEGLGLSVFFDVERLDAGDEWSDVLDRELKSAGAVVALWSPHALSRPWVRKECALAQSRGVLLPALLEPVSDLDMPVQFSGLQRVDLSDFHGQVDHTGWRKLVRALAKVLKRNDLLAAQIAALKEEKQTAKVKAELEATQKELDKLRKSKGGVKPAFVAVGLVLLLVLGGASAWWGVGEMARREKAAGDQIKASIVDPELMKALSTIPEDRMASADYRQLLETALQRVTLPRLVEASTVDADAALLAGWAYLQGLGGVAPDEKEANVFFGRSCERGNQRACVVWALSYQKGQGVPEDKAKAASLYEQACNAGSGFGCTFLGIMYENGNGIAKDGGQAAALYSRACERSYADGCAGLGVMYQNGGDLPKDLAKAHDFLQRGCAGNSADACAALAFMYQQGEGVSQDTANAMLLYAKACDGRQVAACFNLGQIHEVGQGVETDKAEAALWYGKACDGGFAKACAGLGFLYEMGAGVTRNAEKARELLTTACNGGYPSSCYNLGVIHQTGRGVAKDDALAFSFYTKACNEGDAQGCVSLGLMYETARGVPEDKVHAALLYARGCDRGVISGCEYAGDLYAFGEGAVQDQKKGRTYLEKACKAESQTSCLSLKALSQAE